MLRPENVSCHRCVASDRRHRDPKRGAGTIPDPGHISTAANGRVKRYPVRKFVWSKLQKIMDRVDERIQQQTEFVDEGLSAILEGQREMSERIEAIGPDYLIPALDRRSVDDLRWTTAEFLNWANGAEGYAAQSGLWTNPPVQLAHDVGRVGVLTVNERIVEYPYAFRQLASLPAGSSILDVGGSESTLALSLASLAMRVTVVDPRGYPFTHPHITLADVALEAFRPSAQFDAAIAISSIEHFGLGAYGEPAGLDPRPDLTAMRALRDHVRTDGLLILTVPHAGASRTVTAMHRLYDDAALDDLLEGWTVEDRRVVWRHGDTVWDAARPVAPGVAVALVTARNRGA